MGYVGICSFINICWELMGQDQKLGQQWDAISGQRLKGRRWVKIALIAGRLLAAVWTHGGDLDHLYASWSPILCSILVAILGKWVDCKMGGTVWIILCKGPSYDKGSISSGIPLWWIGGPALFSNSMVIEVMEGLVFSFCTEDPVALITLSAQLTGAGRIFSSLYLFEVEKLLKSWEKREIWKWWWYIFLLDLSYILVVIKMISRPDPRTCDPGGAGFHLQYGNMNIDFWSSHSEHLINS